MILLQVKLFLWEKTYQYNYLTSENWVSELTGNEFEKDDIKLTDKIPQYYKEKYNNTVIRQNLGEVILDEQSVRASLAHGFSRNKVIAFAAVPDIIQKGIIIDERQNWKDRGYDSYTIAAPLKIGNEGFVGIVIVNRHPNTNRFYLHEVVLQKSLQEDVFKTDNKAAQPQGDIAKVIKNIIQSSKNSSKAVDKNGEPKKLYHGSPHTFSIFEENRIGETTGNSGMFGEGFYFSPDKMIAELYMDFSNGDLSENRMLIESFLNVKNSLNIKQDYHNYQTFIDFIKMLSHFENLSQLKVDSYTIKEVQELIDKSGLTDSKAIKDFLKDKIDTDGVKQIIFKNGSKKFSDAAKKDGFDSIIAYTEDPNNIDAEYIVHSSNQVKSTTGNTEFDENNPDIRFQYDSIEERETIKQEAIANGTFMLAPNEKKTNLTEEQWLLVRTERFKKWFGDWENVSETIKGLEILQSFFEGKTGLLGSVNNIEIGSINVYSGETGTVEKQYKDGSGLEHIIARRWLEGNNVVETLFGINEVLSKGKIIRDYGGDIGRIDLQYDNYIAIISKQKDFGKEQWVLSGFKIKSDVERESYNPDNYTPYSSVSRSKVVADFNAKIQQKIESVKDVSKVVDENGEPKPMYHGTGIQFYEFLEEKFGQTDSGWYGKGFYFASNKQGAFYYANNKGKRTGTPVMMEIFLNIKNPLVISSDIRELSGEEIAIENLKSFSKINGLKNLQLNNKTLEQIGKEFEEAEERTKNSSWQEQHKEKMKIHRDNNLGNYDLGLIRQLGVETFNEEVRKAGFDGIIINSTSIEKEEYLVFNSNQIKSATENIGEFDENNPDIRFQYDSIEERETIKQEAIANGT
ncbi:MAG: hypothetical protein LBG80_08870, partial [Bacteroidales bacterium]|nr:hypothetical protein [Bacteroidales bacterium]